MNIALGHFHRPLDAPTATQMRLYTGGVEHFVAHIKGEVALHGPLDPQLCRIGQQIIDTAMASATQKRTLLLFA